LPVPPVIATTVLPSSENGPSTVICPPGTLSYASASFNNKNVGSGKPVSVSGISVSGGADAGNYHLVNATASATANITVRLITVTAKTDMKVYDSTTSSSQTPDITSNFSQTFETKTVGTGKTLIPAGFVYDGNSGNNYDVTFVDKTNGSITAVQLTVTGITASNKVWDGNTTATLNTSGATLNGVFAGDTVTLSVSSATGAFSSSNVGTWTVQIAGVTIGSLDAGNYTVMQPTAVASITAWNAAGNGFYAPVGADAAHSVFTPAGSGPTPTTPGAMMWNTAKAGSTIPLKFNVYAGIVEKTGAEAFPGMNLNTAFTSKQVACDSSSTQDDLVDFTTTGNTSLRYDTTAMQWIQNWQTPKVSGTTCYRAFVTFADGSTLESFFKLTK
jgi:YDG domain-containing protein